MAKDKKEKRFEVELKEKDLTSFSRIIVDNQTGVQYLLYGSDSGCGLTLLVDPEGRPLLSPAHMR